MSENIISVNHIRKSFKDTSVLDDINVKFESGKIYGIVGYNGSGKTVFFKCICGFFYVDQGEIIVNGKVLGKDIGILENAGIIIEEPGYLRNLNGYKNLEYLYRILNKSNKHRIYDVMSRVGLDPLSKKRVSHYSLGMKQRLAIAQAIMEDQDILILDEPMNGLDHKGVEEMRDLFLELKKEGKLILMASHNRADIDILCDEVYEMEMGKLKRIRNK